MRAKSVVLPLLVLGGAICEPVWGGAAFSFYGSNATGKTFNRPNADGSSLSGKIVAYAVQPFFVNAAATCTIRSVQEGSFDGWLLLYRGSFNPSQPLSNLEAVNDDGELGKGSSAIVNAALNPNQDYYLVTAGAEAGVVGNFTNFVACSGAARVIPGNGSVPSTDGRYGELLGGRFRVSATWKDFEARTGSARFVPLGSEESGVLWFFSPTNFEVMIKVLDACGFNNRYWVFYAALTNVEFEITVDDTFTGTRKTYRNSLGVSAPAVTDTNAFETCP